MSSPAITDQLQIPQLELPPGCEMPSAAQHMSKGLALELQQSWLPIEQPEFRPGIARLGWSSAGELLVYADLQDDDIRAHRPTEHWRLWQLGDVLEIFLQLDATSPYYEMHVTPNGDCYCLRWPSYEKHVDFARQPTWPAGLEGFACVPTPFDAAVRVQTEFGCWQVLVRIPLPALFPELKSGSLAGSCWRINVTRYDYTLGAPDSQQVPPPVLSATADLPRRSFHLVGYWTRVELA